MVSADSLPVLPHPPRRVVISAAQTHKSHLTMESKTEQTELELASVPIGTKKAVSFTNEQNGSYSAAPPQAYRGASAVMPQCSVKTWLRAEIVVLCIMVVVVWILLSVPLIFYHLPEKTQVSEFCAHLGM